MAAKKPSGLDRRKVVAALLAERGDALIVTGLGSPTYDTFAAGDHDLNFYLWGGMGGAAMAGLGLALAQPKRRVLVITGDGEMLMGLGALATIAVEAPKNLAIARPEALARDGAVFARYVAAVEAFCASRSPSGPRPERPSSRSWASGSSTRS